VPLATAREAAADMRQQSAKAGKGVSMHMAADDERASKTKSVSASPVEL
jgi:hypothetical protein